MADAGKADTDKLVSSSEDDLQIVFSGPAVAANKIFVTLSSAGIRLTFTEQRNPKVAPVFRTAALVSIPDAISLRDLLSKVLREIEPQIQDAIAAARKGG
jgi:hypothetical protein